jgi:hypothetical protein
VLTGTRGRASERGLIVRFTVSGRVPLDQQYLHKAKVTSGQKVLKNSFGMHNINKSKRFGQLLSNPSKRRFIMKVYKAKDYFLDYQKMNAKKKYHEEL